MVAININITLLLLFLVTPTGEIWVVIYFIKGMEHVTIMFMSFNKYLFLEVINILIWSI